MSSESFLSIPILMATLFGLIVVSLAVYVFLLPLVVKFVDKDEEVVIEGLTEQTVITGPQVVFLPLFRKSVEVRKALSLGARQ